MLPPPPRQYITKPEDFINYWRSITDPEHLSRIILYVYRMWPVIDLRKFDEPGGKKSITNIDKIVGACPFTPDNWQTEVLRLWGTGDYTWMFNENNINRCRVVNINTPRDLVNWPPILDTRYLSVNDPQNTDYVRWLRGTGRLPSDGEQRREEEDMAENRAVEALTDTISNLTERLVDERARTQAPAPAIQLPPSAEAKAVAVGMDMIKGAQEASIEMMKKGMELINERAASGNDPLAAVEKIVTLAKTLNGNDSKDSGMTDMLREMLRQSQQREERLLAKLDALSAAPAQPPQQPKTLIEQLTEMKAVRELLGDAAGVNIGGGNSEDDDDRPRRRNGSIWMTLLENIPDILKHGVAITHNAAQMMRANAANRPPQPPQYPGGVAPAQPMQQPPSQPVAELPLMTAPADPAADTPAEPDPMTAALAQYHPLLEAVRVPLVKHIEQNLDGGAFAEWFVMSMENGQMIYDQVREAGPEQLLQLFESYPPLWQSLRLAPRKKLTRFLNEFIDYGADDDAAEDEDETATAAAV
jgi:hypothetical protein